MRRDTMIVGAIYLGGVLAAAGCRSTTCPTIGCFDQFSASVRRADGSFPSGSHRLEVLADGASLTCAFTFPAADASGGGYVYAACPSGLMVNVSPALSCTDVTTGTAVSRRCDPIPGQFVESISLTGTPGQVHVWQYVDDAAVLDAAAAPTYQDAQPNGPECGSVCRQALVAWTMN
jgi:hypothetical protein